MIDIDLLPNGRPYIVREYIDIWRRAIGVGVKDVSYESKDDC